MQNCALASTPVNYKSPTFHLSSASPLKIFTLHYLLPFLILGLVVLHIWALHVPGNNNPVGIDIKKPSKDTVPFHPYIVIKDAFALLMFCIVFALFVFSPAHSSFVYLALERHQLPLETIPPNSRTPKSSPHGGSLADSPDLFIYVHRCSSMFITLCRWWGRTPSPSPNFQKPL